MRGLWTLLLPELEGAEEEMWSVLSRGPFLVFLGCEPLRVGVRKPILWPDVSPCCRKGDPFQVPEGGFCLTLRNESSEETRVLTKYETLLEKGTQAESRKVRGTQQGCSITCPSVSDFMVMGLVSGLFPATRSESGCFLVAHALLSQDGFQ